MTKSFLMTSALCLGFAATGCGSDEPAADAGGSGGSGTGGKATGGAAGSGTGGKATGGAAGSGTGGKATGGAAGGPSDASTDSGDASYPKGCDFPDAAAYNPTVNPADFVTTIDNKYFPLPPGTTFHSEDADGNTDDFEVTTQTKVILGVTVVVVHDVLHLANGDLKEDTFDWFAQDKKGNVWYFGEDTKEYLNGQVSSTHGSWTAGVNCARIGIIMEADPKVGDKYREEYYAGEAEDEAEVLSITQTVTIPYRAGDAGTAASDAGDGGGGTYTNCLQTKNTTRLEPGAVENKWYCAGLGEVKAKEIVTVGTGKVEMLTSVTHK